MRYQIYIYTLALEDDFYYVGKTIDPDRRFNEHFNDKGAEWTKLHSPVSVIEKESFLVSSLEEEDRWENHQTIKMMKAKGWQKVRGGRFTFVGEQLHLKKVFERYKIEGGKYIALTPKEKHHLKYECRKLRKLNTPEE